MLRSLEENLSQGRYRIHYVHNATVNRRDFYRQLCIGMGLEPRAIFAALFACVSQHIQDLASQQKLRVVLLIDEAHMRHPRLITSQILNLDKNAQAQNMPIGFLEACGNPNIE